MIQATFIADTMFFVCIRYIFLVFFGSCVFCELTQLIGCLRFLAAHLAWFD